MSLRIVLVWRGQHGTLSCQQRLCMYVRICKAVLAAVTSMSTARQDPGFLTWSFWDVQIFPNSHRPSVSWLKLGKHITCRLAPLEPFKLTFNRFFLLQM